tara:strand:- start:18339 stop:19409 length:1071 start_codon:yes stop_codon:yes gene_type:complete
MTKLTGLRVRRLSLPLRVPYKLAFGPVTAFDTIIVDIVDDDGHKGMGEATILTGYTSETIDGCWQTVCRLAKTIVGLDADAAKDALSVHHQATPFAVTALVTAIEMMQGHPLLKPTPDSRVPLLATLNATEDAEIICEVQAHADAGYTTIKVKIGWDVADDLARTRFIQSCLPPGVRIRVDGNQGYSRDEGIAYASQIEPDGIELLEQPCHMDDWAAAKAVAAVSNVPFMLDESIYGPDEIERAAALGNVSYVKLKLMKAGSIDNLAAQLRLIRALGMTPVLGNGVASDLGCWMEACIARTLIDNAGEMNGFLKPVTPLFRDPLKVMDGAVVLPSTVPSLGDLGAFIKDTHSFGGL